MQIDRLSQKYVSAYRSVLWLFFFLAAFLNHNNNPSTILAWGCHVPGYFYENPPQCGGKQQTKTNHHYTVNVCKSSGQCGVGKKQQQKNKKSFHNDRHIEQSVQHIHNKGLKEENSGACACVTWFKTVWGWCRLKYSCQSSILDRMMNYLRKAAGPCGCTEDTYHPKTCSLPRQQSCMCYL